MDLIQRINRSHGLGDSDAERTNDDPVVVLRGRLERACERKRARLEYTVNSSERASFLESRVSVCAAQKTMEGRREGGLWDTASEIAA